MESRPLPLHALTLAETLRYFSAGGASEHQGRHVFQAIHRQGTRNPAEIPELSRSARILLEAVPALPALVLDTIVRAQDGTLKLRLLLPDGQAIEAVIIPAPRRVTLCLSSQVGCAAGCSFCHTASMGLRRNLEAWEIIDQQRIAQEVWQRERSGEQPPRITNIVFMGMGEPLHNEEAVVRACRVLGESLGAGFPIRRLVVSTAGVGARIRPLWDANVAALAISLHATTDEVRDGLVPLNRQCNTTELRRIFLNIPWRANESLTVAYVLLEGINDSLRDAEGLAEWITGLPAKVNLLEFNPFPETQYRRSSPERAQAFRLALRELGVFHTVRHSRGADAMAACGQLAGASSETSGRRA